MPKGFLRKRSGIVLLVSLMALVALVASRPGNAALSRFTLDPTIRVGPRGHSIITGGAFACRADERIRVYVRIVQRTSGALATARFPALDLPPEGTATGDAARRAYRCNGRLKRWSSRGATYGKQPRPLKPGSATACAIVETRMGNRYTDIRAFCRAVSVR